MCSRPNTPIPLYSNTPVCLLIALTRLDPVWERLGMPIMALRLTAETRRALSKKFLIKKYSDLCVLWASAVNPAFCRSVGFSRAVVQILSH